MKNLFDSENYPSQEPKKLINGARWAWKRSDVADVYPTDTYTLKYSISSQGDVKDYTITASKVDGDHVVEVSSSETNYNPGDYLWKAIIVRDSDSEEVVIDEGIFEVKSQNGEVSSHVYRTLKAIQATIEGKASSDQLSYSINGRSLNRYTYDELIKLEKRYLSRWAKEKSDLERENGRKANNRVRVRLNA